MSPADRQIREEALRWFVRARAEGFGPDERGQLVSWLERDGRHRREYDLLQQVWDRAGELEHRYGRPSVTPLRGGLRRAAAMAMSACVMMAIVLVLFRYSSVDYAAPPGGRLSVQLAEGVRAELDADSAIRVNRLALHPDVTLVRGSAYFDVDAVRSGLEVHAAQATLRDIGTRFSATVLENEGRVAVAEGKVEVTLGGARRTLESGRQARFAAGRIGEPDFCDLQQVAPWMNGEYRFAAATLAEVADALWRHGRMRVEIPDARVATLTVSGNFDMAEPEKLMRAIARIHGLQFRTRAGGYELLSDS